MTDSGHHQEIRQRSDGNHTGHLLGRSEDGISDRGEIPVDGRRPQALSDVRQCSCPISRQNQGTRDTDRTTPILDPVASLQSPASQKGRHRTAPGPRTGAQAAACGKRNDPRGYGGRRRSRRLAAPNSASRSRTHWCMALRSSGVRRSTPQPGLVGGDHQPIARLVQPGHRVEAASDGYPLGSGLHEGIESSLMTPSRSRTMTFIPDRGRCAPAR